MNNTNLSTDSATTSMQKLSAVLSSAEFVSAEYVDKSVDKELYAWYLNRFRLCKEDGVIININGYLTKLQKERCNDYTKQKINLCAMDIICGGNGHEI